jgi:hypothetical protein
VERRTLSAEIRTSREILTGASALRVLIYAWRASGIDSTVVYLRVARWFIVGKSKQTATALRELSLNLDAALMNSTFIILSLWCNGILDWLPQSVFPNDTLSLQYNNPHPLCMCMLHTHISHRSWCRHKRVLGWIPLPFFFQLSQKHFLNWQASVERANFLPRSSRQKI